EDLGTALHDIDAKCLIFSCTLTEHLNGLEEAIAYVRAEHTSLVIGVGRKSGILRRYRVTPCPNPLSGCLNRGK
ncbi:hypothetical protein ACW7EJ_09075, partial [Acinetobacter soli]